MQHKAGDKVRVRSFDSMAAEYGVVGIEISMRFSGKRIIPHGVGFTYPDMAAFCEKEVTIKDISRDYYNNYDYYHIEEDQGEFANIWDDWMFEPDPAAVAADDLDDVQKRIAEAGDD